MLRSSELNTFGITKTNYRVSCAALTGGNLSIKGWDGMVGPPYQKWDGDVFYFFGGSLSAYIA